MLDIVGDFRTKWTMKGDRVGEFFSMMKQKKHMLELNNYGKRMAIQCMTQKRYVL